MASARRPLRRALRMSVLDGMLHAAMVGASESFLGALAVELGHGGTRLALLSTIPLLAGALAQLAAPYLVRLAGSAGRFVVVGAVLQAFSHIGLAAVALSGTADLWPLLLAKVAFWVSGSMIGPGWGAWIAEMTSRIDRPRFLARRTGLVHVALLVSFMSAGVFLNDAGDQLLSRLAILHGVALLFRLASAFALQRQATLIAPRPADEPTGQMSPGRHRVAIPSLLAAVLFAVSMTSPFFTPYMLREMHLSYATFALVLAGGIIGRALVAPWLADAQRRVGLLPLTLLGACGIAATPGAWTLVDSIPSLLVLQVLSGASWAAYEFASFQLLLDGAGAGARLRYLSIVGCATSVAAVVGAVLGGRMLDAFGLSFADVFLTGSVARAVPLVIFVVYLAAGRVGGRLARPVIMRLETVRPGAGALGRPVSSPPARRRPASPPDESGLVS